jgi:hypothetical protein
MGVRLVSRIASVACAWQHVVVVAQRVYVGSSMYSQRLERGLLASLAGPSINDKAGSSATFTSLRPQGSLLSTH